MKVNLKKIGAVLVGATILASSVGFAALTYGNVELVNANGQPTAKVVVGENAAASDGVAAANIAAAIANKAYAQKTLRADLVGDGQAVCEVTDKSVTLKVTMPGLSSTQQAQFNMLIAENTDNDLGDRDESGDVHNVLTDLMDPEANPFQDQTGNLISGFASSIQQTNYNALLIDGTNFDPFEPFQMQSSKFGTTATEYQRLYVQGGTQFDGDDAVRFYDDINGRASLVYQIVFGPSEQGLDLCPGDTSQTLGSCAPQDGLGAARYPIQLLGRPYVISGVEFTGGAGTMSAAFSSDEDVEAPGSGNFVLRIAEEAAYGIVNVGDCLESGDIRVCLDDISEATGPNNIHPAIVSVYQGDSTTPVAQDQINPGTSKEIPIGGGQEVTVHVYQTAPGYTFGSSWAEMAIYEDEFRLESKKRFLDDKDLDPESEWFVEFGLTSDASSPGNDVANATNLKTITLWTDVDAFDDVNDDGLLPGEAIPVVDVPDYTGFEVAVLGLSNADFDSFEVRYRDSQKDFKDIMNPGGGFAANLTAAGYVEVTSSQQDAFRHSSGKRGSELFLLWVDANGNGQPDATGTDHYYAVLRDKDGDYWGLRNYTASGQSEGVDYRYAGSDNGAVTADYVNDGLFLVNLTEDVGEIGSSDETGTLSTTANMSAGLHGSTGTTGDDDKIFYNYTGSRDLSPLGYKSNDLYDEGFITLRGSVVNTLTDTRVRVDVSDRVRDFSLVVRPVGVSTEPNSQILGPLREGDSETVGDVTIEVQSIDVTTATGGAGSASATIVDASTGADLGQTVDAVTPYDVGRLVYLDSDVVDDTGVLVTVGGPVVNTVTRAAMEEAGLELTPGNPVLVEVVGDRIVVAGYTAEDTLAAADQFLSALQES